MSKRQKERQRAEKKARKEARRRENALQSEDKDVPDGVDPDIAGIVPGPQPLPSEYGLDQDDEDGEESSDED